MLNEGHALIRDSARAFAQDKVKPFAAEWEREGTLPKEIFAEAAALGLMGVTIPEGYGGADAGVTALAVMLEEIAAGDASLSTALSVHNSLTSAAILRFGGEEQKRFWLPKMAAGEVLGAFALTETQAGSDAAAIRCRAEKRGNGWRRSRCITTFEGRPADAATILGHLAEYFGKEQQDDKPQDDRHM